MLKDKLIKNLKKYQGLLIAIRKCNIKSASIVYIEHSLRQFFKCYPIAALNWSKGSNRYLRCPRSDYSDADSRMPASK